MDVADSAIKDELPFLKQRAKLKKLRRHGMSTVGAFVFASMQKTRTLSHRERNLASKAKSDFPPEKASLERIELLACHTDVSLSSATTINVTVCALKLSPGFIAFRGDDRCIPILISVSFHPRFHSDTPERLFSSCRREKAEFPWNSERANRSEGHFLERWIRCFNDKERFRARDDRRERHAIGDLNVVSHGADRQDPSQSGSHFSHRLC